MDEAQTIKELHAEIIRLTDQAKAARWQIGAMPGLVNESAHELGHRLACLGAEFQALAVRLKQATRQAAEQERMEIAA